MQKACFNLLMIVLLAALVYPAPLRLLPSGSIDPAAPRLAAISPAPGYSEVIDSNQTWSGNTAIDSDQDVLVVNCTLTIEDGNVTVYGNLTLQNVQIVYGGVSRRSYFYVFDHGNVSLYTVNVLTAAGPEPMEEVGWNSYGYSKIEMHATVFFWSGGAYSFAWAYQYSTVKVYDSTVGDVESHDASIVEIYDSTVSDIASYNASKVRVERSHVNATATYDDAIHDFALTWLAGRCVGWGAYWCPRVSFYNCTVPVIDATNATVEIAHTTITTLNTRGTVSVKFDNMTITGNWTHHGLLYWMAGFSVGSSMSWSIEWGDPIASGLLVDEAGIGIKEIAINSSAPPAPLPPALRSIGIYLHLIVQGNFTALVRIHYTEDQVAGLRLSSLRLYRHRVEGWEDDFEVTGINLAEKYVWGNLTSIGGTESFSEWFAGLGESLPDLAVLAVLTSKTVVGQGYGVNINVTVANHGGFTVAFNLSVYASTEVTPALQPINTTAVILTNGTYTTITVTWNTTGWAKGNYTLSYIPEVEGEVVVHFVDGWVVVTLPGDVDGDRDVDIFDIVRMGGVYGLSQPDPLFDPNCDLDGDGDIDIFDIVAAARHYGESW